MHASVRAWTAAVLDPTEITGGQVLEVGSCNVNGTVRPIIEAHHPAGYLGVDQEPGPNVDEVVDAARLVARFGAEAFDLVICTEMLEHVDDWRAVVAEIVAVTRRSGLLAVTTRSEGFPYHAFPVDRWRFSLAQMRAVVERAGCEVVDLRSDPQYPGVFCKARRTGDPDVAALGDIEVGRAPLPRHA